MTADGYPGELGPWPVFELTEPMRVMWEDEPPHDRVYVLDAAFPAEPGDMRLEQRERDWERDEAEQPDEAFGADPGWVDA